MPAPDAARTATAPETASETLRYGCPGCGKGNPLPPAAVGRKARCVGCARVFRVSSDLLHRSTKPAADGASDLDEDFGDFLNDMVEEHFEEEDAEAVRELEARMNQLKPAPKPKADPAPASTAPATPPAPAAPPAFARKPLPPALKTPTPARPKPEAPAHVGANFGLTASKPASNDAAKTAAPAANPTDAAPSRHAFLEPSAPRPFLAVRHVRITGVTLAFSETWLNHPRFRLSFPRRCAFSGTPDNLTARPMVFINHHDSGDAEARGIEMKYEHTMTPATELETVAAAIDRIEGLAAPFDLPLLYFAAPDYFDAAVDCVAVRTADDWGYCEVTLPSAEVALEWIARVNGICDPAYHDLADAVDRLSAAAWNRLPSRTRSRIKAWCRFGDAEDFLAYSRDADLPADDAGLAGLVLTSRRVISRRFRKTETLDLADLTHARVQNGNGTIRLTVRTAAGQSVDLNPMPRGDAPLLFDALESAAPNLQIEADPTPTA